MLSRFKTLAVACESDINLFAEYKQVGRHLKLEQIANESAKLLIPLFYEAYSMPIRKPIVRAPAWKKERDFSGQFIAQGWSGVIELNEKYCNPKQGYHGVVAHELGHAATYQNNPRFFEVISDNTHSFLYNAISEGIALEFEKTGLEALFEAECITREDFSKEFGFYKKGISSGSLWKMGHRLMNFMKQRASVKEIICSPEKHFDAIMSKYGKRITAAAKDAYRKPA